MTELQLYKLKTKLSEYGAIQICKADYVFTLLMLGDNFTNVKPYQEISKLVMDATKEEYPWVEAIRYEDTYICMILKPDPNA